MKIADNFEKSFDNLFNYVKLGGDGTIGIEIDVLPNWINIDEDAADVQIEYEGHRFYIVVPTEEFNNRTIQLVHLYRAIEEHKEVRIRLLRYCGIRDVEFVF